jgi:enoyl-CoA hydratase
MNVIYKKEGQIGKVILNRPQERNALDLETLKQLMDAFKQSIINGDLVVLFMAEGKDFSVGADLKYAYSLLNKPEAFGESVEYLKTFQELTRVMRKHDGVIIAGLKGYVIGGGFEIALSCDLRIASKDTIIMMPELRLGTMFSNASTKILPNLVGETKAKEIMLLENRITAEEAHKLGLINYIVDPEKLPDELERIAQKILNKEAHAIKIAKKLINENQDMDIETVLEKELIALIACSLSDGFKKRLMAFIEKEKLSKV